MFILPPEGDDMGWSAQKVSNIHCMLQVGVVLNATVMSSNTARYLIYVQRVVVSIPDQI
jgi:hypothetical protein